MSDGIELQVDTVGSGPPVLWLPGGPGLNNYLHPVADAFLGFSNVLPDPRGTGRSEGGPHNLEDAIRDLEDLRHALGHDRWTVLGHSWGADLALAYGLEHDDVVSAIVSFAGTGLQNDRDWHATYEARLDQEPHGDYQHSPDVHRDLLGDWRRFIQAPDLLARVANLAVPITFLHPARDIRPGWPARQLADLAPHGRFVELADAPHEAWLTHQAALVSALKAILGGEDPLPPRARLD